MHRVARMKDQLLELASKQLAQGAEKVDTQEMGMVVDMIKDLCCAEKDAAEADYYESVVDAMEEGGRYGYEPSRSNRSNVGRGGRQGYDMTPDEPDDRMGYANQYGRNWPANPSNRRRMRRRGYSDESVENIRSMMEDADPERRKQLKKDLEELMREM